MKNGKREYKRYKIFADINITVKKLKTTGVAYNVSCSGISFVADIKFKVGDICIITFQELRAKSFLLKGQIINIKNIESAYDLKRYGIQFNKPIDKDTIDTIVDIFKLK